MFAIAREKKNAKQRKKNGHFPRETKKLCGNHHLQQRQKLRKICGTTQNTYNLLRSAVSIVTFTRKKKKRKEYFIFFEVFVPSIAFALVIDERSLSTQ